MEDILYRRYSKMLQEKYGERVYKIPVNLPITCPNRNGRAGYGGCTFCGEEGTGFENLCSSMSIENQIQENIDYIKVRYKAEKFIAYFQNYSNTYMLLSDFKSALEQVRHKDIVEVAIATRPDCINDKYLEALKEHSKTTGHHITIELGLQTINYHTLLKVNRGHELAEYVDAVIRIKKYGFEICTHLILNLPWDNETDVIENAKMMSALQIDSVKLHALYILKNTVMGNQYEKGELNMISLEEYQERVITFLEYLHPSITVQRLLGRAPQGRAIFANWDTSWWKVRDDIEEKMRKRGSYQGKQCDYLNGKAVKHLIDN